MKRFLSLLLIPGLLLSGCGLEDAEPAAAGQPGNDHIVSSEAFGATAEPSNPKPESSGEENIISASPGLQANKPNVIRWSTASEHDSFGYDIYRGTREAGPFTVINKEVIPGAGTTDMPSSYEFFDDVIEPDTTYWYYIESISLTGERKRITPIYPSKRKPNNN